jgi:hypothetical protein
MLDTSWGYHGVMVGKKAQDYPKETLQMQESPITLAPQG